MAKKESSWLDWGIKALGGDDKKGSGVLSKVKQRNAKMECLSTDGQWDEEGGYCYDLVDEEEGSEE